MIHGLGAFTIDACQHAGAIDELVREFADLVEEANGRPPSYRRAREAYAVYRADPSDANREALRAIYESVPAQNRMYCGTMDSKDWPIRRVLYPDELGADDDDDA